MEPDLTDPNGRSGEMLDGALLGMAAAQCARLGDGKALTLRLGAECAECRVCPECLAVFNQQ